MLPIKHVVSMMRNIGERETPKNLQSRCRPSKQISNSQELKPSDPTPRFQQKGKKVIHKLTKTYERHVR